MVRDVDVSYEVHFKDAETTERPGSLASAVEPDHRRRGAADARGRPLRDPVREPGRRERFPWDRFPSVEVHLRHRDEANGIDEQRPGPKLTEEKLDAVWPMFVVDRTGTSYEVRTVHARGRQQRRRHRLADDRRRADHRAATRSARASSRWSPTLSWDEVPRRLRRRALRGPRQRRPGRGDSLHLSRGRRLRRRFVVDLRDPNRTAIEFTVTFTFKDGTSKQLPPSVTHDRRIMVQPGDARPPRGRDPPSAPTGRPDRCATSRWRCASRTSSRT